MIYLLNSTSVSRQLYPDVKASHLGSVSVLHSGVSVVGSSGQEVDEDAGDLWEGEGEGADADVPDGEAGDGDGDQALPLDLQGHGGTSRDGLVQGDLHVEGDGLPGGDDQGEGLHRDVVQGEHVRVCSITESHP